MADSHGNAVHLGERDVHLLAVSHDAGLGWGQAQQLAERRAGSASGAKFEDLSEKRSTWHRLDVLEAVTDRLRPQRGVSGERWE